MWSVGKRSCSSADNVASYALFGNNAMHRCISPWAGRISNAIPHKPWPAGDFSTLVLNSMAFKRAPSVSPEQQPIYIRQSTHFEFQSAKIECQRGEFEFQSVDIEFQSA